MKEAMVVYIFDRDGRVLLGEKQVKYCAGALVGPGGHVEIGESVYSATLRETEEESGLIPEIDRALGVVLFRHADPRNDILVHMFRADRYRGTLRETEALTNWAWHLPNEETIARMMEGDRFWFHHIINKTTFDAEVVYDADRRVVRHRVTSL